MTAKSLWGPAERFHANLGDDGKIRIGVFDRIATVGRKVKEGRESEFNLDTLASMVANWPRRGDLLSMCHNHQSAYVEQNGQPAPALAFYEALAVVIGDQVVVHPAPLHVIVRSLR
jgi:hypothetical protein